MDAAHPAGPLEPTHRVERHEPVRILVRQRDVEAPVYRFVPPRGEGVGAGEVVAEPALRTHRLEVVGIPLGNAAGLGHERDQRGGEICDRRRRLHAVHVAGDLRARLAPELCEQELDRALGAGLLGDVVPPETAERDSPRLRPTRSPAPTRAPRQARRDAGAHRASRPRSRRSVRRRPRRPPLTPGFSSCMAATAGIPRSAAAAAKRAQA